MLSVSSPRLGAGGRLVRRAFGIAALGVTLATGCGDNKESGRRYAFALRPPATPSATKCGLAREGSARHGRRPPKPGTYIYRTTGRRVLLGRKRRVRRLPSRTKIIVTASRRRDGLSCFAMQRSYERDLGETGVFIIRGRETFLRSGRFQAGADVTEFTPDPPPLVLSNTDLEWSGAFRGPTSGRYESTVVGRKKVSVGGKLVPVVGVSTRVSYAGDIEGFERATRWFSVARSVVVAESVTQERDFGLDRLRLRYHSRVGALDPSRSASARRSG